MKNTSMKKKALLSSVAMLLVALVALGSATFAWFAANPNATASGLSMKTTAAAGLVVRTDSDSTWDHDAALNMGGSTLLFNPVSQEQTTANSAKFWKVAAANASNYAAGTDNMTAGVPSTFESTTGDYYTEKVYFALTTGSDATAEADKEVYLTGVKITGVSGANLQNAINVCITAADGTILGTWEIATTGDNGTLTTTSKTAGDFSPAAAVAAETFATPIATGQKALTVQPASGTTANYVNVYVYLDGQDSACYSEHLAAQDAAEIVSNIQLGFTLSQSATE